MGTFLQAPTQCLDSSRFYGADSSKWNLFEHFKLWMDLISFRYRTCVFSGNVKQLNRTIVGCIHWKIWSGNKRNKRPCCRRSSVECCHCGYHRTHYISSEVLGATEGIITSLLRPYFCYICSVPTVGHFISFYFYEILSSIYPLISVSSCYDRV